MPLCASGKRSSFVRWMNEPFAGACPPKQVANETLKPFVSAS
jgi:hypothetical protein